MAARSWLLLLAAAVICLCRSGAAQEPSADAAAADPAAAKLTFVPIALTDKAALTVGGKVTWKEADWLVPAASLPATSTWQLAAINASGQASVYGSVRSWVTPCGFLQWFTDTRTIRYNVEVDGCGDSWTYTATRTDGPAMNGTGQVTIVAAVDNCVYSRCAQPGCGSICRCASKATGTCYCGNAKENTGFVRTYVYRMGAEVCGYRPIVPAGAASPVSARSLFEADQGVDRVAISFKFGRYTDTSCMPATAIRALKATRVRCVRLTPNLDGRASTYVQAYGGAGKAGELLPSCSGGTYRVVLGLPKQLGQYQCYITLNDGTPERLLAELRVSPP